MRAAALRTKTGAASAAPVAATETADGFRWRLPLTDLNDLAGLFAAAAADLITGRSHRRLVRECKGDNCGWLFLDKPKSGWPLWCSEATCGTHARVKRFRKKQR
nr:CGNR zinc finger domain-containing protein [Neorhizobium tomejilense]